MNQYLSAKVKAVNHASQEAERVYNVLVPIFRPYVGQKIMKIGGLLAKIEKLIPELSCNHKLHIYRHSSDYSLCWMVKTSEMCSEHACLYHEVGVYVGELKDGVLTKIADWGFLRSDYTEAEILEKRATYQAAKKIADEAKNQLHPFGEWDR